MTRRGLLPLVRQHGNPDARQAGSVVPIRYRRGSSRRSSRAGGTVQRPVMTVTSIVLDAPDAGALAAFYRRLLSWEVRSEEPGWVTLRAPGGGAGLAFQEEANYVRPVWPAGPDDQQMMTHLDIEVDDLDAAGAH